MAQIDSLEIQIAGSAQKANQAMDSLITNLGRLANSLKIDTSGLEKIGKSLNFSGIDKATKTIQSQTQKVSKSLSQITEQYKDLGKGFEIKGSTQQIQKQIDSLTNKLANAKLAKDDFEKSGKTNLGGYETAVKNVIKYTNQIESLKNQLAEIQSIKPNIDFKANGLDGLDEKTKQFEQSLKKLQIPPINTENINALQRELAKSEENFEKLRVKLANGIAMGRISANVDDKGFRTLKEQMALAERTAEELREKIKQVQQTSGQTSNGARKLGDSVKYASKSFTGLASSSARAIKPLNNLRNSFKSLLGTILPILGIRQLFNWGKQSIEIASDLTEVQNVVDTTFGDMAYKVEDFAQNSIKQFGLSELSLKEFSSRFQAMGTAMGFPISRMSDISIELTKLTADMSSFYNVAQEDVAKSLQSIFTGETEPLRKYGLDLTQATLQEWALKQGLDADMQSMSQAEKTMLRYQYVLANTGAAQGDFARTADTWANQVRILRQNFEQLASVIGASFINALKPFVKALNAVMSHIIAFAKTVSNALGKIFGWTFEEGEGGLAQDLEGAVDVADDIADSTGTAADNIKKMQAGLRSFDELKVINMPDENDGTGGGAGAGLGGVGGGTLGGNWIQGDSLLKQYESEIDTLYKLGEYIGKTLTDAMDSIDWESVYEKARNFGKGLADFLNGLISPELFGALGRTIAGSLNTAVYAALSFGETFDWKDFGLSIASGINNFFETFSFSLLADTINVWAHGILDTIIEMLANIEWEEIGTKIGIFLSGLDFLGIGKKIATAIWEGITDVWETWKASFSIAPIETAILTLLAAPALVGFGSKIIAFIVTPFKNVLGLISPIISTIGTVISMVSAPVLALTAVFAGLAAGLGYVFATNEEVRESFSQGISKIIEGLQPALDFITNTLLPDLNAGWKRLLEILSPLGDFLNGMFVSVWQDMINPALTYIGETALPKVTESFENLWNNVLVPLGSFLGDVLEPVIKIVSDVLEMLWKNVVVPLANAIGNILGKGFEGLVDIFNYVVERIQPVITVIQFLWDNVLSPLVDYLWDTFKPIFEEVFNTIGGLIDSLGDIFGGLIDFVVGTFTGNWEKAWNGIKDIFKGIWNGIVSIVEGVINIIIKGINDFLGTFDGIANAFGDIIGININIPKIPELSLPKFAKGGLVMKHTFAEIGEMNRPEAVLPLSDKKAMRMVAGSITENANYSLYDLGYEGDYIRQIEEATYRGTVRAIQAAGGIKAEATFKVENDRDSIFKITQEESSKFFKRTGKAAYEF